MTPVESDEILTPLDTEGGDGARGRGGEKEEGKSIQDDGLKTPSPP